MANHQIKDPIEVCYFFFGWAPLSFLLANHPSRVPSFLRLAFYHVSKEK